MQKKIMDIVRKRLIFVFVAFYFYYKLTVCQSAGNLSTESQWQQCIRRDSHIVCSYIPKDLPADTKSVHLRNIPDSTLNKGSFSSHNWRKVKKLEISADDDLEHDTVKLFSSSCFFELNILEVLRISISDSFQFTPKTFTGLNNLKLLDLSGCLRLSLDSLVKAINQPGLVPHLQSLNLSRLNSYYEGMEFNDQFFKLISDKQVKELDISATQINFFDFDAFVNNCHSLEYLNISRIRYSGFSSLNVDQLCPNLKYVDASFITLPSSVMAYLGRTIVISNIKILFDLNWTLYPLKVIQSIEFMNLAAFVPKGMKYSLENVTVHLLGAVKFHLKVLILRNNYFDRLNMKLFTRNVSLEKIDLSSCGIRFLHPDVISSFSSLTWIDLSRNHLNKMMTENANLFGEMFRNLSQLLYISLAGNALTDIPFDIFKSNSRAEIIDLSSNLITNLSFETRYLKHLRLLNLTGNVIKSIDAAYLKTFDHVSLLLKQNPLSCSRCDSFAFIHWLFTSESTKKYLSELKCENENSEQVYVRKGIVDNLKEICNRQNIIIISSIACSFAIILVLVVVLTVRRYLRQRKYKLEMEDRVALIRQGAEPYTFVVFLSYSSNDDDFINDYVHNPLNVHLQSVIGEERDLVCEGDRNFQLGRSIPEQVSILLKKSSVVVVLLTDNYSLSVHCRNEIDQAFMLEKPIVLMIKDHVDTDLMTPNIRDLYETKTRILWIRENETYALKTSWDNVCTSIVELAGNK